MGDNREVVLEVAEDFMSIDSDEPNFDRGILGFDGKNLTPLQIEPTFAVSACPTCSP